MSLSLPTFELLNQFDTPEQYARDHQFALALLRRFSARPPTQTPFEWVIENVVFNEPEIKGPFDPIGREYMRDVVNDVVNDRVSKQTLCWGTGSAKTVAFMVAEAYEMEFNPHRTLWVMPATEGPGGASKFNTTRLQKMIEATASLAAKIPKGSLRKACFASKHLSMGGNVIDFGGSNSPGQLAANRCSRVRLDEVDKFKDVLGNESGSIYLAGERTKNVPGAKIFQSSSPTIDGGNIWKLLVGDADDTASDCRRRFLPCPHCNPHVFGQEKLALCRQGEFPSGDAMLKGWFAVVWSDQYTSLPNKFPNRVTIPLATMQWDPKAKRPSGGWDLERVIQTAHLRCPHCAGEIRDNHRVWQDKNGLWIPTLRGSPNHAGYHLPSLCAPMRDAASSFGGMAEKFLKCVDDGNIKGMVNSDFAEPATTNAAGRHAIEINTIPVSQPDWVPLLTADFHKNHPYIWFVVRNWCAFRLLPPFPMENGLPTFVRDLVRPENQTAKTICDQLIYGDNPVPLTLPTSPFSLSLWSVLAELMRFDSRTGRSPIIDFLLAQKITGEKLLNLYAESAGPQKNTHDFRKAIYRAMALHQYGAAEAIRAPRGGDSELLAAGFCDLSGEAVWGELTDIATEFNVGKGMPIPNRCVAVDCGYAERFDRQVLRKCHEQGKSFHYYDPLLKNPSAIFAKKNHRFCLPVPIDSWFALRGKPTNRPLGTGKINHELFLNLEDPFYGTSEAGTAMVQILELPSGLFWHHWDNLRQKKTKQTHTISPHVSWFPKNYMPDGSRLAESTFKPTQYEAHINEQFYDEKKGTVEPRHGKGGRQSRMHPYHLGDCEVYQVALATHHQFFDHEAVK